MRVHRSPLRQIGLQLRISVTVRVDCRQSTCTLVRVTLVAEAGFLAMELHRPILLVPDCLLVALELGFFFIQWVISRALSQVRVVPLFLVHLDLIIEAFLLQLQLQLLLLVFQFLESPFAIHVINLVLEHLSRLPLFLFHKASNALVLLIVLRHAVMQQVLRRLVVSLWQLVIALPVLLLVRLLDNVVDFLWYRWGLHILNVCFWNYYFLRFLIHHLACGLFGRHHCYLFY